MSDSKFSTGVAFLTMLKFAYFWLLGVHLGSYRSLLRGWTFSNIIFGMSFDSLMTSARKINGSKKSQSLRSEIMCHPTLKVNCNMLSWLSENDTCLETHGSWVQISPRPLDLVEMYEISIFMFVDNATSTWEFGYLSSTYQETYNGGYLVILVF